jgi:hypothetical protein
MNPQEGPPCFPFCQCIDLKKPCCGSFMTCFLDEVLICRWVRGRKPVLNIPSPLVTYKISSISTAKCEGNTTNVSFRLFRLKFGEEQLRPRVSTGNTCFARGTYPNLVVYYLLTPSHLIESAQNYVYKRPCALRTFHDYLNIAHKTMDDTQGLRHSHPSLVLGQSIQSLENGLYLALPQ